MRRRRFSALRFRCHVCAWGYSGNYRTRLVVVDHEWWCAFCIKHIGDPRQLELAL